MTRNLLIAVLGMYLVVTSADAGAGQIVREFTGDRSKDTVEFEVKAPWLIDWRVNSDYPGEMGLSIILLKAPSETYVGRVVKTKYRGDGLRLMNEGGRFRFKVDSALANWTIRVEQLSEDEVEQYQAKDKSLLD